MPEDESRNAEYRKGKSTARHERLAAKAQQESARAPASRGPSPKQQARCAQLGFQVIAQDDLEFKCRGRESGPDDRGVQGNGRNTRNRDQTTRR